jgi:putative transposase
LKRAYANRRTLHKRKPSQRGARRFSPHPSDRLVQLPLDRDELLAVMQDSLDGLTVQMGLLCASAILEDEVTRLCGARYERQPGREHTRYGHQRGVTTLAGQKLPIERPRVRKADGSGEVALETYARLQSDDAMPQAVLRRMIRGVSTRDYEDVIDMAREGFGVGHSCVSREWHEVKE